MEIYTPARAEALAHPYATRTTGPRLPRPPNRLKARLHALAARLLPVTRKDGACC